jgi:hypothetical protein
MEYLAAVRSSVLSIEGTRVVWKDIQGLLLNSFNHPTAPISCTLACLNDHLHICILVDINSLRVHDMTLGDAREIILPVPMKSLIYVSTYNMLILQSADMNPKLFSLTYPSMTVKKVGIKSNDDHSDDDEFGGAALCAYLNTICCNIDDLLCTWNGSSLCIWRFLRAGCENIDESNNHMSINGSHRSPSIASSMSPSGESKLAYPHHF